jgi:hypothetical protein
MSDGRRTALGGWIVALGIAVIIVGSVFLIVGDVDWRLGTSFGAGLVLLTLGGIVMGSASEEYRRQLLSRWGYLAGVSHGGWDPERRKRERD